MKGEGAKTVVLTCKTKWSKYERGGQSRSSSLLRQGCQMSQISYRIWRTNISAIFFKIEIIIEPRPWIGQNLSIRIRCLCYISAIQKWSKIKLLTLDVCAKVLQNESEVKPFFYNFMFCHMSLKLIKKLSETFFIKIIHLCHFSLVWKWSKMKFSTLDICATFLQNETEAQPLTVFWMETNKRSFIFQVIRSFECLCVCVCRCVCVCVCVHVHVCVCVWPILNNYKQACLLYQCACRVFETKSIFYTIPRTSRAHFKLDDIQEKLQPWNC
jgi:hypothetical protein